MEFLGHHVGTQILAVDSEDEQTVVGVRHQRTYLLVGKLVLAYPGAGHAHLLGAVRGKVGPRQRLAVRQIKLVVVTLLVILDICLRDLRGSQTRAVFGKERRLTDYAVEIVKVIARNHSIVESVPGDVAQAHAVAGVHHLLGSSRERHLHHSRVRNQLLTGSVLLQTEDYQIIGLSGGQRGRCRSLVVVCPGMHEHVAVVVPHAELQIVVEHGLGLSHHGVLALLVERRGVVGGHIIVDRRILRSHCRGNARARDFSDLHREVVTLGHSRLVGGEQHVELDHGGAFVSVGIDYPHGAFGLIHLRILRGSRDGKHLVLERHRPAERPGGHESLRNPVALHLIGLGLPESEYGDLGNFAQDKVEVTLLGDRDHGAVGKGEIDVLVILGDSREE